MYREKGNGDKRVNGLYGCKEEERKNKESPKQRKEKDISRQKSNPLIDIMKNAQ